MQVTGMMSQTTVAILMEHEAISANSSKCARQHKAYMSGVKQHSCKWRDLVGAGDLYHYCYPNLDEGDWNDQHPPAMDSGQT